MTYAVLLRLDSAGACPVIVRDDAEPLRGAEGVRWRFVAQTQDHGEAVRMAERLQPRDPPGSRTSSRPGRRGDT